MPKIVEYTSTAAQDRINPTNTGVSATESAARRLGSFAEQEAAGTKEIGALTSQYDKEAGRTLEVAAQAISTFTRFKALQDLADAEAKAKLQQENSVGFKVAGGGGGGAERTLLGTGSGGDTNWNAQANASNLTYDHLQEMHGGPAYLSRAARQAASPRNARQRNNQSDQKQEDDFWKKSNADEHKAFMKDNPEFFQDPVAQMQAITKDANEPRITQDYADKNPAYTGPGSGFGPGFSDPYASQTDTGAPSSPRQETSSNVSSAPSLWNQISDAFSMPSQTNEGVP